MKKEVISLELIQRDLRYRARRAIIAGSIIAPLSVLLFWPIVKAIISTNFHYRNVLLLVIPICFLVLSVSSFYRVFKLRGFIKNPEKLLVTDCVVNMERKEITYSRSGLQGIYWYLYFGKYGKYLLRDDEYIMSDLYWRYKAEDVYCSSAIGDEFYLVLSEPSKGIVMNVYNTKFFELPLSKVDSTVN